MDFIAVQIPQEQLLQVPKLLTYPASGRAAQMEGGRQGGRDQADCSVWERGTGNAGSRRKG